MRGKVLKSRGADRHRATQARSVVGFSIADAVLSCSKKSKTTKGGFAPELMARPSPPWSAWSCGPAGLPGLAARQSSSLTHGLVDRSPDRPTESFRPGTDPVVATPRCATEDPGRQCRDAGGLLRGKPGQPDGIWIKGVSDQRPPNRGRAMKGENSRAHRPRRSLVNHQQVVNIRSVF